MKNKAHILSVAPMMDWTDRHDRVFLRLITRHARLYTEMVPAGAIVHGDRARVLRFAPVERPLALQVGGADPGELAICAHHAAAAGFDEINLNVGCPSGRVQKGRFGACLLAEPELVASCVAAMAGAADLPVTVKTRVGVDDIDSFDHLAAFTARIREAGCRTLIVHARKAWLQGLSPKENREVPPLDTDRVYRLKAAFPDMTVVLNGGIESLDAAWSHLTKIDGVMIGRAAYKNPYMLADADRRLFGDPRPAPGREEVVAALLPYIEGQLAEGVPLHAVTRHILGLYNGCAGARAWRRYLSEAARMPGAGPEVVEQALCLVRAVREGRHAA